MQSKGFIIFLTVLISALCIYYLSFTFISRNIQQQATEYATDADNNVDYSKKQAYLDSVWSEPVYNLFGIEYTYEEIKDTELNRGLDLQGGMYVNLEVSPVEIIKGLSGNNENPTFLEALDIAKERQKDSQETFTQLFYDSFKELEPDGKLSSIFASAANRDRFNFQSSDEEILSVIEDEVEDAIDRSYKIIQTRVDRFGTSQPNVQRLQGTGRIQVEIPGADNPERVRKLLQGVAKLEFLDVADWSEIGPAMQGINLKLMAEEKASRDQKMVASGDSAETIDDISVLLADDPDAASTGTGGDTDSLGNELADQLSASDSTSALDSLDLQVSKLFQVLQVSPYGMYSDLRDSSQVNDYINREDIKALLPANIKLLWAVKPADLQGDGSNNLLELYAIKTQRGGKAPLTGEVITNAWQDYDERGRPAVYMSMNATGARKWAAMTAGAATTGTRISIVLDNYVYSAPGVEQEIPNGSSVISGNFTIDEASDLANVLKAGALPAPTRIVQEAIIGPTLGKEAQSQGINSILIGLAVVVVFMIAYYARGGFVANLALLFNVFFILGVLAQLNAALTLPGAAGIVLTIGMAIDANVLIFERIREELRLGSKLKAAINTGYKKAYSSIIDANVTTFLTAVILYVLGQGPVKGFAITLMIGIVCSFFSAVFISRVIVEWMSRKGDESKMNFQTGLSKDFLSNINIDFLGKRKLGYTFSTIFITVGLIIMFTTGGLNFGVDFLGGRSYVVTFNDAVVASDLKAALADDFGNTSPDVKTFGGNNVLKITTSYLIDEDNEDADSQVETALIQGIQEFTGLQYIHDDARVDESHFTISSSEKVGATIADDIKSASVESILFSLTAIFLYIFMRFRKWQFGLGAVVALLHDTLVVLSAFAIAGLLGFKYEVDQVFIAAMLTIVGYSINDTVVVFDRIRENISLNHKKEMVANFNEAINSTMSRTLITSFTTLVVVLILFIFGGAVLKGFSFALLIGILVGTYSSVFIATPVVVDLSNRKGKPVQVKSEQKPVAATV
ncbi:MAG: protein translocase subunit SecDF [Cyclobacteriaceae bacterium]|nr:MAG: protein translocase subunit SecDF [Cyclobacteriaceae bacterium]